MTLFICLPKQRVLGGQTSKVIQRPVEESKGIDCDYFLVRIIRCWGRHPIPIFEEKSSSHKMSAIRAVEHIQKKHFLLSCG